MLGHLRLKEEVDCRSALRNVHLRAFGIYPINHVVIIRSDALRRLPGLPRALFEAYVQAKSRAYALQLGTNLMPWGARHWKKTFDQFDGDPLPYGLNEINRKAVAKLAGYLYDQKLISRQPNVQALFLPVSE